MTLSHSSKPAGTLGRTFRGPSIREALKRVKAELGDHAVIIDTREVRDETTEARVAFEVTVAAPRQSAPPDEPAAPSAEREVERPPAPVSGADESSALPDELRALRRALEELEGRLSGQLRSLGSERRVRDPAALQLMRQGASAEVAEEIARRASADVCPIRGLRVARAPDLAATLAAGLQAAAPLWERPPGSAHALVGGSGSGRTSVALSSAWRARAAGRRPLLVAADVYRLGEAERVARYGELLGVEVVMAGTPEELTAALDKRGDVDLTLIDLEPMSPFDQASPRRLARWLGHSPIERHLVCPAMNAARVREIDRILRREWKMSSIVVTKGDEAPGPATLLDAAWRVLLPVSQIQLGPLIPDDTDAFDPTAWLNRIVSSAREGARV